MPEPIDSKIPVRDSTREIVFTHSKRPQALIGNELNKHRSHELPEEVRKYSFENGCIIVEMSDGTTRKIKPDEKYPQHKKLNERNQNDSIKFDYFYGDWGFKQDFDTSNDNAFDITHEVDHTNDKNFIPIGSEPWKKPGK